jgi:hypothetical protein
MKVSPTYRPTHLRIERSNALPLVLMLSLLLTFLAFLPFTERPEFANRNTLALNRIVEISLLLVCAALLTAAAAAYRVNIRFERKPLFFVGAFSIWALLTTMWSEAPLYTFGKSMELIVLVYITGLASSLAFECERLGSDTVGANGAPVNRHHSSAGVSRLHFSHDPDGFGGVFFQVSEGRHCGAINRRSGLDRKPGADGNISDFLACLCLCSAQANRLAPNL